MFARGAARVIGVRDAHIFSTLGRTRGLFRGWLHFSGRLLALSGLSRRDTELVIIRVALVRGCDYELDHHRAIGRRAGIDDGVYTRLVTGPSDPAWSARDRALLTAVDELVADRQISDAAWADLAAHLDERRLVAFVLLVGQYDSLATTISTLGIARDEPRRG